MQQAFLHTQLAHTEKVNSVSPQMGIQGARQARQFHQSFPMYCPTPLVALQEMAGALGLGAVHVKDESQRFGLNAFKVLGGSFAIGSHIAQQLKIDIGALPFEKMISRAVLEKLGECTFITATDGNHGRGVAWTASQLGQRAVVYMPTGTAQERCDNIRALGAECEITDRNYDGCVRLASELAEQSGWVLVQDTSWPGYEQIPLWIMQGYNTIPLEAVEQLDQTGEQLPTHVFLQAGVGSMAGAVAAFLADLMGEKRPVITIVEPNAADCLYRTALADDGKLHAVTGDLRTIMAGLACGEPCSVAWELLREHADHFISCPEYAAANGMRMLGAPQGQDARIVSGESGASTFGCLAELMLNPSLQGVKEQIGLSEASRVLLISTEGATDRRNYWDVVWNGKYPATC